MKDKLSLLLELVTELCYRYRKMKNHTTHYDATRWKTDAEGELLQAAEQEYFITVSYDTAELNKLKISTNNIIHSSLNNLKNKTIKTWGSVLQMKGKKEKILFKWSPS